MDNHQDMSRRQGRTQTGAGNRLSQLKEQGHQVHLEGNNDHVEATITRREGTTHHITIKPEDLPEGIREAVAFRQYPQTVMLAHALHTIADWSADIDRHRAHAVTV